MIEMRQAYPHEFDAIMAFYHALIDDMETADYTPGWIKDVYPTNSFIQTAIANNEAFVGILDETIACVMVMDHECNTGYDAVNWPSAHEKDQIVVIHALGIHPSYQGRGIAKQMCQYAIQWAKRNNIKAIRLDVLGTNLPAQNLYAAMGFQYVDTIKLFYEDTGWADYLLYQHDIH